MTLQVDLWSLVGLLCGLVTTLAGLGLTFARMLLTQVERRLDERFQALQKSREDARSVCLSRFQTLDSERREEIAQWQRVERDLLALRAELPLHYVRREDYVRGQTVLEAKIDALALKLENLQLRSPQTNDRRRAVRIDPNPPGEPTDDPV